jgi:hypothetical protein
MGSIASVWGQGFRHVSLDCHSRLVTFQRGALPGVGHDPHHAIDIV